MKNKTNKEWNNISKTKPCMFCGNQIPNGLGFNDEKYHKRGCPLGKQNGISSGFKFSPASVFERMRKKLKSGKKK